jgi:hypothetical protein
MMKNSATELMQEANSRKHGKNPSLLILSLLHYITLHYITLQYFSTHPTANLVYKNYLIICINIIYFEFNFTAKNFLLQNSATKVVSLIFLYCSFHVYFKAHKEILAKKMNFTLKI